MTAADWSTYGQWLAIAILIIACACVIVDLLSRQPARDDDDSDQYGC